MEQKLKLLLVDDNPLNQRLMEVMLRKDYEITIANNGQEAVELFSRSRFDAVLMDIMMPIMDGFEATAKIREFEATNGIEQRTPIVAITGNSFDNDRQKCLDCGMDEYLTKPFVVDELHSALRRLWMPGTALGL